MNNIKEQILMLNKVSKMSLAIYHKFALSIGVSDSTLGVLYALYEIETPCSQYDLCAKWFIPKQTINTAVNILKKKNFVTLLPVQGSRNKKCIVLTSLGKEFANKTLKKLQDAEFSSLEELSPEEREVYVELNKKYNETLTKKISSIIENIK